MKSPTFLASLALMAAVAHAADPAVFSFDDAPAGPVPDALMAVEGEFHVVEDGANKVLELAAEPVVDGLLVLGPSMKDAGTVSARLKAGKSRRAFPRLGVGLFGVSGVKLRLVPAEKKAELVAGDAATEPAVAEVPLEWKEDAWLHVELSVKPAGAGKWSAEGRWWAEGATRPEKATISAELTSAPGQGKASVLGSPYANKPIWFDDVTPTPAP